MRELSDLPEAGSGWEDLRARPPASLSGSRSWVMAAFAAAHPGAVPFVVSAEAGRQLVALLPLALHVHAGGPVLRFAGAPHNDLSDLMVTARYKPSVGRAVLAALVASASRRGWSVSLDEVDPEGALAAAACGGSPLAWSPGSIAPRIDLRGEWRAAASDHRRGAWERSLRRLQRRHAVRFRRVDARGLLRAFPEFLRVRAARLAATGRHELPPRAFLEATVAELAMSGACALVELLVDGRPAASDLYLTDRPVAMLWIRGLDPRWRQYPCGHLLLREGAERFAADGFEVLDLGRGEEPYKFLFGAQRRALLRARLTGRAH